jgi:stage II sporulation protein D
MMKGALLFIAVFALLMLVIPMIAIGYPIESSGEPAVVHTPQPAPQLTQPAWSQPAAEAEDALVAPQAPPAFPVGEEPDTSSVVLGVAEFRLLDESTGEVLTVPVRDFIRGAVAAEMPASFHTEALKAQAVAAHTYALHHHRVQQENPDPELKGADFKVDLANRKVYITEEMAREFYGKLADEYWEKVCAAADSVAHLVLEYEGEPIVAAYHAISSGMTEDAANVWEGESVPYLRPASSEGDYLAPDYETEKEFSYAEVKDLLLAVYPDLNLSGSPDTWFGAMERSPSGYVTSIEVGGQVLHGKDIRTALDLRSHNFDVVDTGNGFVFVVYGYGHGVGLSQYGADFMARQGATFEEILANYYSGATLAEVALPE